MPQISNEALAERAKVNQLKPKLADVSKAMGKEVRYRTLPDGRREPYIRFTPNKQGKTTREWGVAHESIKPWVKADTERMAKVNGAPGEYGIVGNGKLVLLGGLNPLNFCPECEMRWSWCECAGDADAGRASLTRGTEAAPAK